MNGRMPLVTVGIPTYNREQLIERAVGSVLAQDYPNIEVIISDNCSTDSSANICARLANADSRVRFIQQACNIGATRNFEAVLTGANGEFFMWLGDDDHLDQNYIRATLTPMLDDSSLALASGEARYYRGDRLVDVGRCFDVLSSTWWGRVAEYYWKVSDNGMFYGLMRTSTLRRGRIENAMGGDWLLIARAAASGKMVMSKQAIVHRELGGASQNHRHTAKALRLPRRHALFPYVFIAVHAFRDIVFLPEAYPDHGPTARRLAGTLAFGVLLVRAVTSSSAEWLVRLRDGLKRVPGSVKRRA